MMRSVRLWLLALCWLMLLPADLLAAEVVDGQTVSAIRVVGNRKIEADAILQAVHTMAGQPARAEQIRKDIRDIYSLGFFQDVEVLAEEGEGGLILIFRVVEKPAIRSVQFEGFDKVNEEDLRDAIDLRLYSILDESKVQENVKKLQALYAEKGYYLANVKADLRAAGAEDVAVVFVIEEGQKVLVKRIYFVGDEQVETEKFERYITNQDSGYMGWLSTAGTFNAEAVEDDALIIAAYYFDQGYVQARVETPEVYLSPDRTYLSITHRIHEGDRYRLGEVKVGGELIVPEEELLKLISLKKGEWFSRTLLSQDLQNLSDRYSDEGYAFAEVIPLTDLDEAAHTIAVTYQFNPNTRVYLNQIHISGNSVTWDKTIRRELPINEGELFRGSVVKEGKRRLQRLGYFEEVNITTPRVGDDKLDLSVQVKEKPTGTFNVGAGLSSVENFVFTANISKQNFVGLGYVMAASASLSSVRRLFNLSFSDPYFLDTRWTFRVDGYNVDQTLYQDEYRRGVSVALGHYLGTGDDAVFQLRYAFEQQGISNLDQFLLQLYGGELYRSGDASSVEASFTLDKRNDRLNSTSGYRLSWASELAGGFALPSGDKFIDLLGGDFNYHRHQANFRYYYPIVSKTPDALVFRFNTTLGAVFSTDGTLLPLLQRYRAGGINSVRGFPMMSLGPITRYLVSYEPTNPDDDRIVGGYQIMTTNLELEFAILRQAGIRGVVFFDTGNAFDLFGYDLQAGTTEAEIRSDRLPRFAAGLGVRWFSPMGPLRFEWGFPLDRREGEDLYQFEFTIGSFF